jgi:peptidoglycan hydrolase CwlO-like protein
MTVKRVLTIIGMIALGVLITIGVEETRSGVMKRALLTEIQTLQENNQGLQTKNDELTQKIKTLGAEVKTLQGEKEDLQTKNDELTEQIKALKTEPGVKIREYEGEISQLEEEATIGETANQDIEALRAQVRALQEENEELQAKNHELADEINALKAELGTKIRIVPNK